MLIHILTVIKLTPKKSQVQVQIHVHTHKYTEELTKGYSEQDNSPTLVHLASRSQN